MTTVLTQSVDILISREKQYGVDNMVSTATGAATAATRWADTSFGTTLIDGTLEDGTYFDDEYYLVPYTGTAANIGVPRKVSSWVTADDEFEVASAWPATPQANDKAYLCKMARATLNSDKITHHKIERNNQSRTHTQASPVAGHVEGDLDLTFEYIASMVMHELLLLGAGAQLQAMDSSVIVSGGSTSAIRITNGDGTKAALNGLIAVDVGSGSWEPARITAIDESPGGYDELTISPALSTNPAASQAVKFLQCYQSAEEDRISLTVYVCTNKNIKKYTGVRANLDIPELTRSGIPMLHLVCKADQGTRESGQLPFNMVYANQEPPANFNGYARLNGNDYELLAASFDYAAEIAEKPVFEGTTGRKEWLPVGRAGGEKFTCRMYDDGNNARFDLYKDNTEIEFLVMCGSPANAAGCVMFCVPTGTILDMSDADEGGLKTHNANGRVHDNQTSTSNLSNRLVVGFTT